MSGEELLRPRLARRSVESIVRSIKRRESALARSWETTSRNKYRPRFYFHLRFVEGDGQSWRVDSSDPKRVEDFAQLLVRLKDTYGVSDSEIARRIGVSPATVNAWVHRKRGTGRGPARDILVAIAREFPKFSEAEIFAAVGRKAPGPLSPEAEARIQVLYRELTADQQEDFEAQLAAVVERNRSRP